MSELLKINVNDHTERKNGLTYLSWAWAWAEVLKHDPEATWVTHTYGPQGSEEPCMRVGKTAMVHVSVTINHLRRECMLPVMDHRNKAIPDPDAFDVNKAIMRCLAKAIAMHGLGLYIYAGEDLPEGDAQEKAQVIRAVPAQDKDAAYEAHKEALEEAALVMVEAHNGGNRSAALEVWQALTSKEDKAYVWGLLERETKLRDFLKAANKEQKAA
jgi:hypothetical protein